MARIKYFGHSAFEIELKGLDNKDKVVLIDPWIDNPLSPVKLDYFRHKKVDYILVTHDHGDHLGNAYDIAKLTGATIIGIFEIAEEASGKGLKAVGGNIGGRLSLEDLEIVLTPALHSSNKGSPVGFIVKGADISLYHAGDTGLFSEMSLISELYSPEVALLPIGGHFTMGVKEAFRAVLMLKPKVVIPMHYNTFPLIKADPYKFKELVESLTPTRVIVLKPGEEFEYP
ncbi:metal-dependent hydrolase [Thermogladius sp. 4427co]|uniref:metal-dependent hydrolase n=1 Tax=Thermogladius sp. 4427co TaxID=3450718 RepID=UPI003F7AC4B4